MRIKLAVVGVVAVGAVAIAGVQLARRAPSKNKEIVAAKPKAPAKAKKRPEADDRSHHAGTHRAGPAELAVRNRVAREESLKLQRRLAAVRGQKTSAAATTWVSVGPTDSPQEFNGSLIDGVDSGRPNSIVVDPRDANVVYNAVSGGGVWKTYNFLAPGGPTWIPVSDTLPNLAVGSLAIDATHPDTLYLGNGDFVDASGNTIFKSTDGGATWSAPVTLAGMYSTNVPAVVGSIRQVAADGTSVWAATDAGLFHSTDGGATFALFDLPEPTGVVAEALWSIVPIGGGGWVASGLTACDVGAPAPGLFGSDPDAVNCPLGNNTTIWRSDDGVTWSMVTGLPQTAGTGRTTLAAGPTATPGSTVVYAYVGETNGQSTLGFWRSKDGGKTWANATGTLGNPTGDCGDLNVGHDQTWYNQAIVVDPTNADHVLVGGNLCGMRTVNGTSDAVVWENVSHWLPGSGGGTSANGTVGYVHADWHTGTSIVINGKVRTFAGTDGGVFSSTNLFDATAPESVVWTHHNRGLATHLFYSVASGDTSTGDPFVLFGGLQDNGTRFRGDPAKPTAYNQPIGGDGIGATVHHSTSGTTFWASVEFGWGWCRPAADSDCSVQDFWFGVPSPVGLTPEQLAEQADERASIRHEDSEPFFVRYSNVETDTVGQSILTNTTEQVFVAIPDGVPAPDSGFTWKSISQDLSASPVGAGISNVTASRTTPGLFGAAGAVSAEPFYVTTQGTTKVDWTVAKPVFIGTNRLTGPSSIDFPPTLASGQVPGQVFVGAFTGTQNDPARTPPPDDKGHLWRTTDGGQTWSSIVGADPAHRLPNVAVYVVKYDPVTATTLYAGTELGVYISIDNGTTWDRMGDNFPMVSVRDMYIAKNQDFIRVATYGRGLWEIFPSATASHGADGDGDYDRNLQIDWIDLAAMSSRLGETPETTTAPLYSWIMDMTGAGTDPPVQSIDTSDLAALLAKLGDHP